MPQTLKYQLTTGAKRRKPYILTAVFTTCLLTGIIAGDIARRSTADTSAADAEAPVDLAVDVASVISLTTNATNGEISIPISPLASGATGSNDLTVSVHTNNQTGYKLTMSSDTPDTSLTHQVENTKKIASTANTLEAPAALTNNTWGYSAWGEGQSTSSTTFSRIPSLSAPDTLRTTSDISDPTDTKLTFGAKVDTTIPSGTYTNTVTFTATSNFVPPFIQYMQSFTASKCNTLASGEMIELRDQRDGTVYRVKKMADGNCWMVDNLALDLTADYTGKPTWGTSPVTLSGTDASANNVPQQTQNNNVEGQGQIPNNGTAKASYLYNWCAALGDTSTDCSASVAATANNTVINGTTVTTGTTTSQPEVTGICPAPFRLPKGGPEATSSSATSTANEFAKLDIAMGGDGTNRSSANTYPLFTGTAVADTNWLGVLSGYYSNDLVNQDSEGFWWSSTAHNATAAYRLYLRSSDTHVSPAYRSSKINGFAVRCILNPSDPDLTQITTMQEMTERVCDITRVGTTKSLRDERDGTYYRVKKMADGNCWMVDNLALDLTADYTGKPSWGTAPVTVSGTDASVNNVPQQAQNNNVAGQGQIPNNGTAKASYLYNWCAALGDTSSTCASSRAAVANNTVINGAIVTTGTTTSQPEVTGICPAPFRLPKGGPQATSSTASTTANEFAKLDIAMGGDGTNRTSANTYDLWTGTAPSKTNWLGVLSGGYNSGFGNQGQRSNWWSSTANGANSTYYLRLDNSNTNVNPANSTNNGRSYSFTVRCVL